MRDFADLAVRGRAQRLRTLAFAALAHYSIEVRRVSLLTNHLNGIFRVDTAGGERYALRISHPTWRTDEDLRAELLWLQALARETDIGAPVPLPSRDDNLVTVAAVAGVPEPRRAIVMSWIPGQNLVERLSEQNARELGALSARLHAHAATWSPPEGFTVRTMHGIYARGEPDELFGEIGQEIVTDESMSVFAQVRERVQAAFGALYADTRGMRAIHNDLHQENVKVWRGRLRPLHFEDTIWGYPVQDIAMTFNDLLFYTDLGNEGYQRLRGAFTEGYSSSAVWPGASHGQIDTFIAGRLLWLANHVLRIERPHARAFCTRMAARLQAFLETRTLLK